MTVKWLIDEDAAAASTEMPTASTTSRELAKAVPLLMLSSPRLALETLF